MLGRQHSQLRTTATQLWELLQAALCLIALKAQIQKADTETLRSYFLTISLYQLQASSSTPGISTLESLGGHHRTVGLGAHNADRNACLGRILSCLQQICQQSLKKGTGPGGCAGQCPCPAGRAASSTAQSWLWPHPAAPPSLLPECIKFAELCSSQQKVVSTLKVQQPFPAGLRYIPCSLHSEPGSSSPLQLHQVLSVHSLAQPLLPPEPARSGLCCPGPPRAALPDSEWKKRKGRRNKKRQGDEWRGHGRMKDGQRGERECL